MTQPQDLKRELQSVGERHPNLAQDEQFLLWYVRAALVDDEEEAKRTLVGASKDKGVDSILIEEEAKSVYVLQGKYRQKVMKTGEPRQDVMQLLSVARALQGDSEEYRGLVEGMAPVAAERLGIARKRLMRRDYVLRLQFVTTGRFSKNLRDEANRTARSIDATSVQLVDGSRILHLLDNYLDGVAPPIPSLDLKIESGQGIKISSPFYRYDGGNKIESWIFSITAAEVADLYERAGVRLFARNVRGFLGNTRINEAMRMTLEQEPDLFWYYNNGITIICDEAELVTTGGRDVLRVANPQVINGQQTTRILSSAGAGNRKASVLVRVIQVSLDHGQQFRRLASQIVAATNWQNAIRPSDLMSNDRTQIEIERRLRKHGYGYIRKRQTIPEAKRVALDPTARFIKKEELAQAVAACDLDPVVVRQGKEGLFEEKLYPLVFPNDDPLYYLPRYWLTRQVQKESKGYPERAYAKWLVTHFMWDLMAPHLKKRQEKEAFVRACETNGRALEPLEKAIGIALREALRFYRANRGRGQKAIDVSTFFKRPGLEKQFALHWKSGSQKYIQQMEKRLNEFSGRLID